MVDRAKQNWKTERRQEEKRRKEKGSKSKLNRWTGVVLSLNNSHPRF